jgi:hypothetical protein
MLAKGENSKLLHQLAKELVLQMEGVTRGKGVNFEIDVDPVFIL